MSEDLGERQSQAVRPQGRDRGLVMVSDAHTFWLVLVVTARPLGRSRAILCFLTIFTDTTGMTTCGWGGGEHAVLRTHSQGHCPCALAPSPSPSRQGATHWYGGEAWPNVAESIRSFPFPRRPPFPDPAFALLSRRPRLAALLSLYPSDGLP